VEVHAGLDDVMMVESGSATLLVGGTVTGARQTAPGEQRGGSIDGGATQPLAPGDVMVIPTGVPHQVVVPQGGSVTYVVVKIPPAAPSTPPR
jgi:mannose-6-phosphate isomerase-like protein (cupin superfamily)